MKSVAFLLAAIAAIAADQGSFSINMKQPDANMYHQQNVHSGQFNYGYNVNTVSNQFQHKVKGPDDVTYGCYGYIDPSNRKHLVYYVADRMGYRIIFPNRPTKIFTDRVTDSLNKLDGATKAKNYDEKVVAWNDLYMPESCFRLDEILSTAASSTHQQVVRPEPELPRPTQYTIPTTTRPVAVDSVHTGGVYVQQTYQGASQGYQGHRQHPQHVNGHVGYEDNDNGNQLPDGDQTQTQQQPIAWSGSLPDINPANINLDQFDVGNGYVDATGSASTTQFTATSAQYPPHQLNVTQLLAQIEAVNSQVITLNTLLAGMANNPGVFASANEGSCRKVIQLLQTQRTTPQLVYVPILIPYVEGQFNVNQPFGANAGHYQQLQQHQQPCGQSCKG
ncbi:uncharacterized protein LOC120420860 [Culex pipiens pallens]|uniref:uncharacterized protein LOC120420860 n=1 Tax=Culex pipiens pallens TaxID=42434 RepID=UPI001953C979|nr:uncharacterized protein LOC120420860 [Culex pipiens pallens]